MIDIEKAIFATKSLNELKNYMKKIIHREKVVAHIRRKI
jgi:hypothetical protein